MSLQYNKVSNKEDLINKIISLSLDKENNNNELIQTLLKKILNYDDDFYTSNTNIKNSDVYYISLIDIYIISKNLIFLYYLLLMIIKSITIFAIIY